MQYNNCFGNVACLINNRKTNVDVLPSKNQALCLYFKHVSVIARCICTLHAWFKYFVQKKSLSNLQLQKYKVSLEEYAIAESQRVI